MFKMIRKSRKKRKEMIMDDWQKAMKIDLDNAKSMNDVLDVMAKYYDLDKELGLMTKGAVILGLQRCIKVTGIKHI